MNKVYVGLGANLGRPVRQLQEALDQLLAQAWVHDLQVSSWYQTPPWGGVEQPDFINAVACWRTSLSPEAVLLELQQLEAAAGRVREGERWGPRPLDLDILHMDGVICSEQHLTLPHPRIAERAFVLLPLAELAPELILPGQGRVSELLAAVDRDGCQRLMVAEST